MLRIVNTTLTCMIAAALLLPVGCGGKKDKKPDGKTMRQAEQAQSDGHPAHPALEEKTPRRDTGRADLTPMGYLGTVVRCRDHGKLTKSMMNLRALGQAIRMHHMEEDKYPVSLEAMVKRGEISQQALRSPGDRDKRIVYLRPKKPNCPTTDVLAFDPVNYVNNHFAILQAGGETVKINLDELKDKLKKQGFE